MKSKIYFILSMIIFGTIGIFIRSIHLASSEIALLRGFIGTLFLLLILIVKKQKISFVRIRENIFLLLISGAALGINWIFLFEAYKYTTIANATLSYYFAPVFVIILSPFILKEKILPKKVLCTAVALLGMFLIMKNGGLGRNAGQDLVGIFYGIAAAACYAGLMLINKFIKRMNGIDTTLLQLIFSTLILLPYVLFTEGVKIHEIIGANAVLLLVVGVIHTGMGFYLFFTGMKNLKGQSIAALSYIDPITSLLVSFIILGERMTLLQFSGAVLLLGATFISEYKKI